MAFAIGDRVRLLVTKDYGGVTIEAGREGTIIGINEIIDAYKVMFDGDSMGRLVASSELGSSSFTGFAAKGVAVASVAGGFAVHGRVRLRVQKDFAGRIVEAGRGGEVTAIREIIGAYRVLFDLEPDAHDVPGEDLESEGPAAVGARPMSPKPSKGASVALAEPGASATGGGVPRGKMRRARDMGKGAGRRALSQTLKILCVHGVGDHHTTDAWQAEWEAAVRSGISQWNPALRMDFEFPIYDAAFERYPVDPEVIAEALWKLGSSGVSSAVEGVSAAVGDLLGRFNPFARQRGLSDLPNQLRWTAGMVAQWAENEPLRAEARAVIAAAVREFEPDVIAAHSLGSLVCYDLFSREEGQRLLQDRSTFVTFGCQIANPFVMGTFGGRIEPIPAAKRWFHLFNPNDRAFAHDIRLTGTGSEEFSQIDATFSDGFLSHDAVRYLSHPGAVSSVWREVSGAPQSAAGARTLKSFHIANGRPERRALLIGINDYPDPENRLEGCVNDVYLVSAALQESGFDPDEIRVVLDDRATAAGILDRLHWLLDEVDNGDQRVLFYSGHGAQIPGYGAQNEVDHVDECLVPWDFDWTPERAILDKQFLQFYSQLPYDSNFVALFDCCHSGGMTRHGAAKVRGLTPPDDIRHRALRWDADMERWLPRDFAPPAHPPGPAGAKTAKRGDAAGDLGVIRSTRRLGQAIPLRTLDDTKYEQAKKQHGGHLGPYMPILFQACQEGQLSYEYRHGATSYGAFTYTLTDVLRRSRRAGQNPTFVELAEQTAKELSLLGYDQTPCFQGPRKKVKLPVPWHGGDKAAVQREAAAGPRSSKPRRRQGKK